MAKFDLSTVGIDGGNRPRQVAASSTRFYAGEPMNSTYTLTAGVASTHFVTVMATNKPRVATDNFQGIAAKDAEITSITNTTVIAHTTFVTSVIPWVTRIRGRGKVFANVDTQSEINALIFNAVDLDLTSAAYTINDTAASNASALQVVGGNPVKGTLDVVLDGRGIRYAVA